MIKKLSSFVPKKIKHLILILLSKLGIKLLNSADLRQSTTYDYIGEQGPLIKEFYSKIVDVPGWFNVDDCGHFYLALTYQSVLEITGDLLEIGSYHGRSTALMTKCLRPGERIVVCDAFEADTDDDYVDKPSPETLLKNIKRVNPDINTDIIIIHNCLSSNLNLDADEKFRFIHIDGGHSAQQVYSDLELCSKHLHAHGIIVIDDYHHNKWPGVTKGVDKFLNDNDKLLKLADINRHGALGRKLYLIKKS